MMTIRALSISTLRLDVRGELARREFGRIDLLEVDQARVTVFLQGQVEGPRTRLDGALPLVEGEEDGVFAPLGRGDGVGQGERGLADACRPDQQGVRAAFEAAAEQLVKLRVAARRRVAGEAPTMLGGDQPRKNPQSPGLDDEIVVAAAELDAAHLDDAEAPALRAVVDGELLQQHHPVRDRMKLEVVLTGAEVVEDHDGAVAAGEEVLQREDLPPIAERILRQQPQFGEAVEDHAGRIDLVDAVEDQLRGLAQLHLGWMKDSQFALRVERRFGGHQFEMSTPSSDQPWRCATRRSSCPVSDKVM